MQFLRLFDACRKTRHELLIEVIVPSDMPSGVTTVASAIRRLYAIGVRPGWWKLEPASDPATWRHIDAAIDEQAIADLASKLNRLVNAWRSARSRARDAGSCKLRSCDTGVLPGRATDLCQQGVL